MKIDNFRKKIATAGVLGLMALPFILPSVTSAHFRGNVRMQRLINGSNEFMFLQTDRLDTSVNLDQNFLMNQRFFGRRLLNQGILGDVSARKTIVIDRTNSNNVIILSNVLTGPGSVNVNRVVLRVDHSFFDQLTSRVNADTDIRIRVNTGNNTVAFNTAAGDLVTGDVTISVR